MQGLTKPGIVIRLKNCEKSISYCTETQKLKFDPDDSKGYGKVISIAHYGKQNGDQMADPEMTFTIVDG